jgi:hypothetical protein
MIASGGGPEEIAARTEAEREAGREAVRRHASNPVPPAADFPVNEAVPDPDVKMPVAVQAVVARGEALHRKFIRSWPRQRLVRPGGPASGPFFTTSVMKSEEVMRRRDAALAAWERQYRRQHPHTLFLLYATMVLVERYRAQGVPFSTSPNSPMFKLILDDLNRLTARARVRLRPVTAGALRPMMRKIKDLLN